MTLTLIATDNDCFIELDAVAIGGGGDYVIQSRAGAGSGYVEAGKIQFSTNSPVMTVSVGSHGHSSRVEAGRLVLLEASPGEDSPSDHNGGDGYSGGGGSGYEDTNGGGRG